MSDFHGQIANCLIAGAEITETPTGWTRNKISLALNGFHLELLQKKEVAVGQVGTYNGRFLHTTDVMVRDIDAKNIPRLERVVENLCWLLSFAGLSSVLYGGFEYPDGSGLGRWSSVIGVANFFRPTLDIRDGTVVRDFVLQVYDTYVSIQKKHRLNVVIDYLVQAERPGQPTELQLLLAFIALESLKDSYARAQGIPYVNGFFRKRPKPKKGRDTFSFEELLEKMIRAVGMRRGLKRTIRLRNEIIHSGVSRLPYSSQWSMYERAHDIIREYLLRLLGYHGSYCTYTERGNRVL